MHRNRRGPRRSGFTLAEALVAVGIIAVLVSILLPALGRVREQGRIAVCTGNERRLYEAVVSYANDNDRYLPCPLFVSPGRHSVNIPANPPASNARSTNGGDRVCWAFQDFNGPVIGLADFRVGSLVTYMGGDADARQRIAWCPGEIADVLARNFSYSFNSAIRPASWGAAGGVDPYLTLRLNDVRNGDRKILVYEERSTNTGGDGVRPDDAEFNMTEFRAWSKPEYRWVPPAWISGRHGAAGEGVSQSGPLTTTPTHRLDVYQDRGWRIRARSNQLFFDGHVELMGVEEFFETDLRLMSQTRAGPTHWPLR